MRDSSKLEQDTEEQYAQLQPAYQSSAYTVGKVGKILTIVGGLSFISGTLYYYAVQKPSGPAVCTAMGVGLVSLIVGGILKWCAGKMY